MARVVSIIQMEVFTLANGTRTRCQVMALSTTLLERLRIRFTNNFIIGIGLLA
jgi:hypothetical protein